MALLADFLANDKPYYMVYQGKTYFPILRGYLDSLGVAPWPEELRYADFTRLSVARALFPPIPYRPSRINLLEPFAEPSRSIGSAPISSGVTSWPALFTGRVFRSRLVLYQ